MAEEDFSTIEMEAMKMKKIQLQLEVSALRDDFLWHVKEVKGLMQMPGLMDETYPNLNPEELEFVKKLSQMVDDRNTAILRSIEGPLQENSEGWNNLEYESKFNSLNQDAMKLLEDITALKEKWLNVKNYLLSENPQLASTDASGENYESIVIKKSETEMSEGECRLKEIIIPGVVSKFKAEEMEFIMQRLRLFDQETTCAIEGGDMN